MIRPIQSPEQDEYGEMYAGYVERVGERDPVDLLGRQIAILDSLTERLDEDAERSSYAEGKWSIRELIGHLMDAERVFGYRALCFSRGDQVELPGFEENHYVGEGRAGEVPVADLLRELEALRYANTRLFQRLDPEQWGRSGIASSARVTVRALAWILAGHFEHHLAVLRERYGLERHEPAEAAFESQPETSD